MLEVMPKWDELFKDVLQFFNDGKTYTRRESTVNIANSLNLSDELREERYEITKVNIIEDRVEWAMSALKRAGLLERPERGMYKISEEGKRLLKNLPEVLDEKYLKNNCPLYRKNVEKNKERNKNRYYNKKENNSFSSINDTPEARIESAIIEKDLNLTEELIEELLKVDPYYFEEIVADLLEKMGYGDLEVTQKSNDGGIDAVVNEDKLGLDKILIQAKRYNEENKIGSQLIQNFLGALDISKVQKGIFVTTSSFSNKAKEVVKNSTKKIRLIDGKELTELMIEYNVGVETEKTYEIKKINSDYFKS